MDSQTLKDYATDAIRFWEPRRLIYNAALAAIVLFYFFKYYPGSKSEITLNGAQGIFILAVLAERLIGLNRSLKMLREYVADKNGTSSLPEMAVQSRSGLSFAHCIKSLER